MTKRCLTAAFLLLAAATVFAGEGVKVRTIDIRISGADYTPAVVKVKKGETVRLAFTRDNKPTCGDEVVFPSLEIRRQVPVNRTVTVDLTPAKTGDISFTCGMKMMSGKIVVQ
ncbi:MAG TPA: cupredoxin domain-containing protein [Thermoanaerobaculia bacterium]|nr:cupredoxin domain-containing protein [Thermoanaerobaculia bacterium]